MTPLPKRRFSTRRQGKKRAAIKIITPTLVRCPKCGQMKKPHQLCPSCKTYKPKNENSPRSSTQKKRENR